MKGSWYLDESFLNHVESQGSTLRTLKHQHHKPSILPQCYKKIYPGRKQQILYHFYFVQGRPPVHKGVRSTRNNRMCYPVSAFGAQYAICYFWLTSRRILEHHPHGIVFCGQIGNTWYQYHISVTYTYKIVLFKNGICYQ